MSQVWVQSLLPLGIMVGAIMIGGGLHRGLNYIFHRGEDKHRQYREQGRNFYRVHFKSLEGPSFFEKKEQVQAFEQELDDEIKMLSQSCDEIVHAAVLEYEEKHSKYATSKHL